LPHLLHDGFQIRGREHGRLDSGKNRHLDGSAGRVHDFTMQYRDNPEGITNVLPRIASAGVFAVSQVEHLNVAKPNRFVIFRFFMDGDRLPMGWSALTPQSNRFSKLGQIFCAYCHNKNAFFSIKDAVLHFLEKSKFPCQRRGYGHAYCIGGIAFYWFRLAQQGHKKAIIPGG